MDERKKVKTYNYNNKLTIIETYLNDKLHSFNDKPAYKLKDNNGNILKLEYYKYGILSRDNDYCIYDNSVTKLHKYLFYKDGKLHRDNDKPAYYLMNNDNVIIFEEWYIDGILARVNPKKPIRITKDFEGNLLSKHYNVQYTTSNGN